MGFRLVRSALSEQSCQFSRVLVRCRPAHVLHTFGAYFYSVLCSFQSNDLLSPPLHRLSPPFKRLQRFSLRASSKRTRLSTLAAITLLLHVSVPVYQSLLWACPKRVPVNDTRDQSLYNSFVLPTSSACNHNLFPGPKLVSACFGCSAFSCYRIFRLSSRTFVSLTQLGH